MILQVDAEWLRRFQEVHLAHRLSEIDNVLSHILHSAIANTLGDKKAHFYHATLKPETIEQLKSLGFKIDATPESKDADAWIYYIFSW